MKAAVCYEFGQPLLIEDVHLDAPQSGEVRVKIGACAICHSDIHIAEGAWGGSLPAVNGHEAAGIVSEIGPNVNHVLVGDHVIVSLIRSCDRCFFCSRGQQYLCEREFALDRESRLKTAMGQPIERGISTGGFAEYVVVDQSQVVTIPKELSFESVSLLACGVITGLGAVVNTAQVPPGSSVVVIGTGGVGLNSVQGAVLSGAQHVIAIDLVDSKREAAKTFGATHAINAADNNVADAVRSLTQGRGADLVFITVGSGAALEQGMQLVRRGGTLAVVGMPPDGVKLNIEAVEFAYNGQRIVGSNMGSTRLDIDVPKLVELYQQGRLKLDELIAARYPLEEINVAIEAVKRGEAIRNVIVF